MFCTKKKIIDKVILKAPPRHDRKIKIEKVYKMTLSLSMISHLNKKEYKKKKSLSQDEPKPHHLSHLPPSPFSNKSDTVSLFPSNDGYFVISV